MKRWAHIELSDNVGGGVTSEGYPFVQTEIVAWNEADMIDLEAVVTVTGTVTRREDSLFIIEGKDPQWKKNAFLQYLAEEAVSILQEEIQSYKDITD